jgi:cell division septation protein DedD
LSADKARPEVLKPREEPPLAAPETAGEPPASSLPVRSERPAVPPAASAAAQGARPGTWIVQVISLRDRNAAAQIVQRLRNKGYPAYLVTPTPGGPTQLYKVQVGKYGDRTEAQQIQARLKKEEQFDTWIVR